MHRNPINKDKNIKKCKTFPTYIPTKPIQKGGGEKIYGGISIENTNESLVGVTKVIEDFGHISGLRINKDKTQAMIFGHESAESKPVDNNMGFQWVKEIKILGVTITCDLQQMEVQNFNAKFEAIEKMLKHWIYRTLNLEGRITITKSLALPKLAHLATVLLELDNQKAKKMEDLTIKFIWRTFNDQTEKKV